MTLPVWARQAPNRAIYRSNATGTWQVHAWDRGTGTTRQVTDQPVGTAKAAIDPTGQWIYWFRCTEGDDFGVWMRQPFRGGPDEVVAPGVEPGQPGCTIFLSATGAAVFSMAYPGAFTTYLVRPGEEPRVLSQSAGPSWVTGISMDGSFIAVNHTESGDMHHPALKVVRQCGEVVGELFDGPGKGTTGLGFAPVPGDRRLLVLHERRNRREPLVWDPVTDEQREIWLKDTGELEAEWYPDGRALLLVRHDRGRTHLHRYDLAGGGLTSIDTPHGVIEAACPRPGGHVEYSWSSSSRPPVIRSTSGQAVMQSGPSAPASVPVEDIDVEGEGGRIHAMVSLPENGAPPYPAIFLLNRTLWSHDSDSFSPETAAWIDNGYAVVRVNYRGSTGYGSAWRDAVHESIGHTQLADLAAVRAHLVARDMIDPRRTALVGQAWGGYLTLLGMGVQPELWAAGIATMPLACLLTAYEDMPEGRRAHYRALFGGPPSEHPERYEASSPLTYVEQVQHPVMILAARAEAGLSSRQLEKYLAKLDEHGREYRLHTYEAGRASLVVGERIAQMAARLEFARKHV
ncbi:prolyl oligopeptidase family serine peptidase [Thermoactinospora rubra]|uniref:S9 family peptidase n=1 Tax=Thermoactinospora rubra TaxID=1088767 RepID=UPI001F0B56E3|nr:prolyl oligopeptidase family serine peptidase [Thermoactinospora rubra]